MIIAQIIFWICVSLIGFTYLAYLPVVWCLSRIFGITRTAGEGNLPAVSILIAAHNEQAVMRQRLDNALGLDYPKDRIEVVVASDGSTDDTARIVRDCNVRLIEFTQRRGKSAAINRAVPQLSPEIVVFSDANTLFDPQAVRKLVRWFDDPAIGSVCGQLVLSDPRTGKNADSLYWKFETALKQCESRLGGLLGANGAIYAMRKEFFTPIPDATIVDDFAIPLLARLNHNCQIVYDIEATAYEETPHTIREEFRRRCRIGVGNWQNLVLLWPLLNPLHGWIAFTFFSHKVLRWICPLFLIGMLISSVILADHRLYFWALNAQLAMYSLAIVSLMVKLPRPLRLAAMFVGMNAALAVGFFRWLVQRPQQSWQPTARLTENR